MVSNFSATLSLNREAGILTNEVGDGLESLLLTHDEANALLLTVAHQLGVANAALLPLFISPAEKLDTVLHHTLEVLLARLGLDSREVNLIK